MVDIDTEREQSIILAKADDYVVPEDKAEIIRHAVLDVSSFVCGIKMIINDTMENEPAVKLLDSVIKDLTDFKEVFIVDEIEEKTDEQN